ncbi:Transport protein particle (TRAPP) component [Nannochloropsis gaditana]|uniref:Trafficking protein particle complex subunit n=1 Tax=Nannochloropsis gaditana TaxID=72520 RepID=W7TEN4_9STRA|nr:Transport protein particle (TRAPP) component [Nannochloropsis gaditana]
MTESKRNAGSGGGGIRMLNILDRPLATKGRGVGGSEVSLSAFSFLFSEMVQYYQNRVLSIADLERKLEEAGYGVGHRVLELLAFREKQYRREIKLIGVLQFVSSTVWKALFNKVADSLERSTENEDEYMIHEREPITNVFVSAPADISQLNCAAYIAGIISGVLNGASYPAGVTAHHVAIGDGQREKTVFLIKFRQDVLRREAALSG